MLRRTLKVSLVVGLLLQAGPLFPADQSRAEGEQLLVRQFTEFFHNCVNESRVTGAAFAVAGADGLLEIGTAGHTDTTLRHPINENTTFRIASVSKTFAAGLTGVLVSEGEFGWDDRLVSHVPDFRIDGDATKVRIRHVLGQSTGLIPHAYDNLIEDGVPMDRIQEQYRKLSYICTPGECYSYQNSIFSLIEPVIEKTTRRTYTELMNEKIFEPLDMRTASVGYESFISNPNHARPHVKRHGEWKTVRVKPNYYRVAPAAGINASALDMSKWLTAQLGGHPEVIRPEVIEILTRPRVKTTRDKRRKYWRDFVSDAHYGLGWRVYQFGDNRINYHSGWVSGYRADIAWSDELGIGIAVLMNVEGSSISEITTRFWQLAFDTLVPAGDSDLADSPAARHVASP